MRAVIGGKVEKIDGHVLRGSVPGSEREQFQSERPDKSVRVTRINGHRIHFRELARMAWPDKTESNLAFIARVDTRTARRWLADDNEPPAAILGIILAEIMRRFHQR